MIENGRKGFFFVNFFFTKVPVIPFQRNTNIVCLLYIVMYFVAAHVVIISAFYFCQLVLG